MPARGIIKRIANYDLVFKILYAPLFHQGSGSLKRGDN